MQHVGSIETIVAQFVCDDFIGWEIGRPVGIGLAETIYQQEQTGFDECVAMHATFRVAVRT